jgi:hypothetical protein
MKVWTMELGLLGLAYVRTFYLRGLNSVELSTYKPTFPQHS